MKKIKTFKKFNEELITDTKFMLDPKMDNFLSKIELYHCGDHIWAIKVLDSHSRAMIFLRAQEFYESAFEEIIGKQFKFSNYMDRYKQHYGKQEFTYGEDWSGFNIPSTVLEKCMFNIPKEEVNNYDKIMISCIETIKSIEGDHNYYLLGVDELDNHLLEHEFAHAMYFTLPEYKSVMDNLTNSCDVAIRDGMFKCITDYGYADHVLMDEMQAYMSTGLGRKMTELKIKNIDEFCKKYRSIFDTYYQKSLYPSPKNIKTNWKGL